jgi:hypothetical protein
MNPVLLRETLGTCFWLRRLDDRKLILLWPIGCFHFASG